MKRHTHTFIIGAFVLGACAILVLAGILFGGGQLFQEKVYFETYFDTSVKGLEKGSKVQFRGVTIGEVESITFASVDYADDLKKATHEDRKALRYVRVLCSIDVKKHPNFSTERLIRMRDNAGLTTSLSMQGITGGMLINLDFESQPTDLTFTWTPKETYIPSHPTTLENILSVSEKIAENLEKIDFSETVAAITALTNKLSLAVDAANIEELSHAISTCAISVETLAKDLDTLVVALGPETLGNDIKTMASALTVVSQTLEKDVPSLTQNANEIMEMTKQNLVALNVLLTKLSPLVSALSEDSAVAHLPTEISDAMQQLSQTLISLEALINTLRERPSRILFDDAE